MRNPSRSAPAVMQLDAKTNMSRKVSSKLEMGFYFSPGYIAPDYIRFCGRLFHFLWVTLVTIQAVQRQTRCVCLFYFLWVTLITPI